eukprot:m.137543 g.137543  ORF g.137543 m.137543 type:complete len:631 (+) comp29926_c0_seq2:89-1981(+)
MMSIMMGRNMCVLPVLLLLLASRVTSQNAEYERKANEIVEHAQQAAKYFNSGEKDLAEQELIASDEAFKAAIALDGESAQAYANMAQALHNSRRPGEAVAIWEETLKRVPTQMAPMIKYRIRKSKHGQLSIDRDVTYQEGRGNVTRTLELAELQAALFKSSPIYFDLATLQVMVSESQVDIIESAMSNFLTSQQIGVEAWAAGLAQTSKRCAKGATLIEDWSVAAKYNFVDFEPIETAADIYGFENVKTLSDSDSDTVLSMRYRDPQCYIATVSGGVEIAGPDAVVTIARKKGKCAIVPGSAGRYVNLAQNVQMLETWDGSPRPGFHDVHLGKIPNHGAGLIEAVRMDTVATITQFASVSFYHFVMEVLPRLLLLLPKLNEDPQLKVLVPHDHAEGKNGFITNLLELIKGENGESLMDRFIPYDTRIPVNDVRIKVKKIIIPSWQPVESLDHVNHCLSPRPLLRQLRGVLAPEILITKRTKVVYLTRKGNNMRQLPNEQKLVKVLQLAVGDGFELIEFDGKLDTVAALKLFQHAVVVVGVHGGAFANIVACGSGTKIIEIAFRSDFTRHYAHASAALSLDYEQVLVSVDKLGRGVSVENVMLANDTAKFASIGESVTLHLHSIRTAKDEL